MWTASDYHHMSRALQLARRGLYSTDPNPRVGCVIVKDDVVLSEGWHQKAGQSHAEIEALNNTKQNQTSDNVSGATCYVTLEPCVHHGRTPPCTDSLINAGIKKVIAAVIDPNPLVAGKGLQQLNEAGIETASGLMEAEVAELNPGFTMRMQHGRPFVRCKLAMSLDGKTALHNGESKWISSPESRMDVQKLRARSSAIMTGIGTVIADDPSMNVRLSESSEWAKCGRQPLRVVLDSELEISPEAKILNVSGDVIIFHQSNDKNRKEQLENIGAELVTVEEARGSAFLKQVLNYLATEKEINEILLETGSTLAGEMLQAGFIDELIIYIAPALFGQDAKSLFQLPMIEDMSDRISLDIADVRSIGKDIRIKATVNR
ncbi:MAG: bifunctional diaminohydroxyphosphoribosylaminopyrimidine deaminase/5-amino-6-(5-phosphoribosylamino)uracil reductase RibD [Gammaproteobacteria bacterium]|nr:MAG: bifunctional diaminohydroxyphosphoribosylaminopyrimidine deaminase/5-amino-6-(5-phosphoribosylamino)uracil reductase RibD [Gammaproteobacteria bacterium]